ncbi:MAG TPA: 4'-phosphopantetheinyl transferase superfamily protein [Phycisphaerae bacterium]|nr:4'-phosphopantetheinyl transferase superfamily protein [Phycisphaerae bacterium]
MILHPVLMPVPGGADLPRPERMPAQRLVSARAVDESARLSGLAPRQWPRDADGVPMPSEGIYWSLSHKPAWTAGVVSDGRVGIDLEAIRPRRDTLLFDKVAGADEWALIGDRNWPNFFRLWTANEATLKANSFGIGRLSDCRIAAVHDETHLTTLFEGREWGIEHFYHDDHVAAVTAGVGGVAWHVLQCPGHGV